MLTQRRKSGEQGIAMLEAAGAFVILLSLLMGVAALVDYLQTLNALNQIVDRQLYDSGVKALTLDSTGNGFALKVDQEGLQRYLLQVVDETEKDLRSTLAGQGGNYFVDAAYAEIAIDPDTGHVSSTPQVSRHYTRGAQGIVPVELLGKTDLENEFQKMAGITRSDGEAFLWAVPVNLGEAAGSARKYVHAVVVVGLRAFYKPESGMGSVLSRILGRDSVYHDFKVVTLRGEYEL